MKVASQSKRQMGIIVSIVLMLVFGVLASIGQKFGAAFEKIVVYFGGALFAMIANFMFIAVGMHIYSSNIDKADYYKITNGGAKYTTYTINAICVSMIVVTMLMFIPKVVVFAGRSIGMMIYGLVKIPVIGIILIGVLATFILAKLAFAYFGRHPLLQVYGASFLHMQITQSAWAAVVMNLAGSRLLMILGTASVSVFFINLFISLLVSILMWNYYFYFDNTAYVQWSGIANKVLARLISEKYPDSPTALALKPNLYMKSEEHWANDALCKKLMLHWLTNHPDIQLSGMGAGNDRESVLAKYEQTGSLPPSFSIFLSLLDTNNKYWNTFKEIL